MELTGAIAGLEAARDEPGRVAIYTDSTYVIQGITKWIWGWRKKGWKTAAGADVINRDLWERLAALVDARGSRHVEWRWVRGHVGTPGNERVDAIAVAFAAQKPPQLYRGPVAHYPIDVLTCPGDTELPHRTSATRAATPAKTPAYSYLSVVDGVLMRHTTWAECERRVKGRSGARFKKSASAADEAAILREWGVAPLNSR
jgi:ribonuclease HI